MSKPQPPVFELNQKAENVPSKIELIKNLLVGEQFEAYEAELEQLRKQMAQKKEALDKLIQDVKTELEQSIDHVSADFNHRITKLEQNINKKLEDIDANSVSKQQLGKLLSKLGDEIAKG